MLYNFDGVRAPTKGLLAAGLAGLRNAYSDLSCVYDDAFNKLGRAAISYAERNCQAALGAYMDHAGGAKSTWLGRFVNKSEPISPLLRAEDPQTLTS